MTQARTVGASFSPPPPPPGDIAVSPTDLQFGSQIVGSSSAAQTVTIENTGEGALHLGQPAIEGEQFGIASTTCGPFPATLDADESCEAAVEFTPTSAGAKAAVLTLPSDDPDEDPVEVDLAGTGIIGPDLAVAPTAVAFGAHLVGEQSEPSEITLSNTGDAPLSVGSVTKLGANPADFIFAAGTCSPLPVELDPAESCKVAVRFAPTVAGARAALLRVASNDPDTAQRDIAVTGTGTLPPEPRPDATIRRSKDAKAIGDGVYETTPKQQVLNWSGKPKQNRTFVIGLQNDGTAAGAVTVDGCASGGNFKLSYKAGGTDVTAAVAAGTYATPSLAPGASVELSLQVKAKKPKGSLSCDVVASSGGSVDAVRAKMRAKG
jgi:hypothetical protein